MNTPFDPNQLPQIRSDASNDVRKKLLEDAKEIYEFRSYDLETLKPENWLITGFINDGITLISGAPGEGKTTAVVPLAVAVSGLYMPNAIETPAPRNVLYITEDRNQVERILFGIFKHQASNTNIQNWNQRFHISSAKRVDVELITQLAEIAKEYKTVHKGITLMPLIVFDTLSANIDINNENDNSEIGKVVAKLKEAFTANEIPIWLITHQAKGSGSSQNNSKSARGASAFEGDVYTTLVLSRDGNKCYLNLKKNRFEPKYPEISFSRRTSSTVSLDVFGDIQDIKYPIVEIEESNPEKRKLEVAASKAEIEKLKKEDQSQGLKQDILQMIHDHPTIPCKNRSWLKHRIGGNSATFSKAIQELVDEQQIEEIDIDPKKYGLHQNQKTTFKIISMPEYKVKKENPDVDF